MEAGSHDAENICKLLDEHYDGGFPIDAIETARFLKLYGETYGKVLDEAVLADTLMRETVRCGGRAFFVSRGIEGDLTTNLRLHFASQRVAFYDDFFKKHRRMLNDAHIYTVPILTEVLKKTFSSASWGWLQFQDKYFGRDVAGRKIPELVQEGILCGWGDGKMCCLDELEKKLYISTDRIVKCLSDHADFVCVSRKERTYAYLPRLEISEAARQAFREAAEERSRRVSFFSLKELPLGDILADNWELETDTDSALYEAAYQICLTDLFDKQGSTLTRKQEPGDGASMMGKKMTALERLKAYCRTQEACTFDDLVEFARPFAPQLARPLARQAGAETMVRLDEERYVSDSYVHFDVAGTDDAIEPFVTDDGLPLDDFAAFGMFPPCGQSWNCYILESFVRRFSKKFDFDAEKGILCKKKDD